VGRPLPGVYALLHNEGLFQRFLLGSPSLAWDQRMLFAANRRVPPCTVRCLRGYSLRLAAAKDPSMLANLRAFASQLVQRQYESLEYTVHVFEGDGHDAVIPATVSRRLRYLYRPGPQ
jgi:uncharacterized protein